MNNSFQRLDKHPCRYVIFFKKSKNVYSQKRCQIKYKITHNSRYAILVLNNISIAQLIREASAFNKVYDTVDHHIITYKLAKLKITETKFNLIDSYLINR